MSRTEPADTASAVFAAIRAAERIETGGRPADPDRLIENVWREFLAAKEQGCRDVLAGRMDHERRDVIVRNRHEAANAAAVRLAAAFQVRTGQRVPPGVLYPEPFWQATQEWAWGNYAGPVGTGFCCEVEARRALETCTDPDQTRGCVIVAPACPTHQYERKDKCPCG